MCEVRLRELNKYKSNDKADEQIKSNIHIQLTEKLKNITNELRKNEKEHFVKIQEIHGEDFLGNKQK